MTEVDMELKDAFGRLQEQAYETSQKLHVADMQIENLQRSKQHAAITARELSSLEPETKTYESVGRMFILKPIDEVKENLKKKQTTADEKIKNLEDSKAYLERKLKEAENNIREMIQLKKDHS